MEIFSGLGPGLLVEKMGRRQKALADMQYLGKNMNIWHNKVRKNNGAAAVGSCQ